MLGAGAVAAGALAAGATVAAGTGAALPGSAARRPPTAPDRLRPVRAALQRLLPDHASQFQLAELTGKERFRVTGSYGRITVAGTSPAVLLTAVHWYLKEVCHAHISWAGSQLSLPWLLPAPGQPIERAATVPHRFALNDTHDGYTGPYADWPRWERLIDVMALHGCNEVLVTPGTEAVYHRLLRGFGYRDSEVRAWLPAPSHQPWWLLQNMSGYGGPVSPELLDRRVELAQRIVRRLRELGMSPVLPGYFGTVPDDFTKRNPRGRTIPQGQWAGLKRPHWLDPRTPVFREAAAAFYHHQRELFGDIEHFKMDLLHEGGNPGDVPAPDAARAVEKALQDAHPGATWVILGWRNNPHRELLDAVADKERMLIVDGLSDLERVTDRERDWGGVPYAFGTIPNFGGRTTIGAKTHMWTRRFTAWRDKPGSKLVGTAYMAEAAERDPAAFELFSELAWRQEAVDRERWFADYAKTRYGDEDRYAHAAFAVLRRTAYEISSADGRPHDSIFAARPSLDARSGTFYATRSPAFDPAGFDSAFAMLLGVRASLRTSDAYRYDLTDMARQALANRSWQLIGQLKAAYVRKDRETFRALSTLWLKLMRLSEEMAGTHEAFLLGPWLADAQRMATGDTERAQLEHSARKLITTWADRPTANGGRLHDYANRDWHGLIGDFYLPRWQRWLDELADALAEGREPREVDWYAVEEPWSRERKEYPLRPVGDPYRTAVRVYHALARAPYQGTLTATLDPVELEPGGRGLLTASFRNVNGLRATGPVDFTLSGLDAVPLDPTAVAAVPAGGTATVRWRVTAPGEPLERPLRRVPYTLGARYAPRGEGDRVRAVYDGELLVAGSLAN
ncbi:alpha-N-acetylglucosaminidase TIM-barrel domain-containing protein [Streptomyces gobiensis]|uniref:alpha-N-acetylglucosaminidase n=1 Tax=Streptomyces gobiensis TaxID=2875706 RepID=UPI003BB03970